MTVSFPSPYSARSPRVVGVVSEWYDPEPVEIPGTVARALSARGHEVRVLTAFPSYPGGVVHEGYRQRWGFTEDLDGIQVRRCPVYATRDTNGLRRMATFASFALSSLGNVRWLWKADAVYVYGTPLTAALPAVALRWLRGTPALLHVQDLWPESVVDSGMAGGGRAARALESAIKAYAALVYASSRMVVAIAPTMASKLAARGVAEAKLSTVLNWTPARPGAGHPERSPAEGGLRVGYIGNLGVMQDVSTIIEAAALCREDPITFRIAGTGPLADGLRAQAADLGLQNIEFVGFVDPSDVAQEFGRSHVQLVTLKDEEVFHGTIPSKFGNALSMGSPVVTTVPGDLGRMVEEHGLGLAAPPSSPQGLAEALRWAARLDSTEYGSLRARVAAFHREQLSPKAGLADIVEKIEHLIREKAGHGE